MAGTRTAPAVNGTPTFQRLTIRCVDSKGDVRSEQFRVPATATDAELEDYVAKWVLISNASVFEVHVNFVYAGVETKTNAENDVRESGDDRVGMLAKDSSADSQNVGFRAPEDAIFVAGTEQPDPTDAALSNWINAGLLLLNGGAGGAGTYAAKSVRLSEHREINQAVKL